LHSKTLAAALNEVTAIIINIKNKTAVHKTFMADLTHDTEFTYCPEAPEEGLDLPVEEAKKYSYILPKGEATHYNPTFWQIDLKWALFFSRHRLIATFFDWFKLRDKAVFPIGYVYNEGTSSPIQPVRAEYDYALENWNTLHNTIIDKRLKRVGAKIDRTQQNPTKWALIIGAIIIVIVVAVVAINMINGNATPPPPVTSPSATPIIIR